MRSVSPVAGTSAIMPILPFAMMLLRPKARLLPIRSGISSVCGSSTRMKPGSSPLGETSIVPSFDVVPTSANGQRESSMRMKPGSSPLGETSIVPSAAVVLTSAKGQRFRKSIDCSSSASRILLRVAGAARR